MTVYVDEQKKSTVKGNKRHKKLESLELPWFHTTPAQTQIAADNKKGFFNLHSTCKFTLNFEHSTCIFKVQKNTKGRKINIRKIVVRLCK